MAGSRKLPGKLRLKRSFDRCEKDFPRSKAKRYPMSAVRVNDQFARTRQRGSEVGVAQIGNLYIKLRLFSHKLAALLIRPLSIPFIKRFTLSEPSTESHPPAPEQVTAEDVFSLFVPLNLHGQYHITPENSDNPGVLVRSTMRRAKFLRGPDEPIGADSACLEGAPMLLDLAKAFSFFGCIMVVYSAAMQTFFLPGSRWEERLAVALLKLALAACVCFLSGMLFTWPTRSNPDRSLALTSTLPVRLFLWSSGAMIVLFFSTWYFSDLVQQAAPFISSRTLQRF